MKINDFHFQPKVVGNDIFLVQICFNFFILSLKQQYKNSLYENINRFEPTDAQTVGGLVPNMVLIKELIN